MKKISRRVALAGMIGALYAALTLLQNALFPGSASADIQFRVAEAMMMLCLFSPTAIAGLTIGCAVANISSGMPWDIVVGPVATLLAGLMIYAMRKITFKGFPFLSLIFPAVCNGVIVGLELTLYFKTPLLLNMAYVALGEVVVSSILGIPFFYQCKKIDIQKYF